MTHTLALVSLLVHGYDEAIAFYRDVLGFELAEDTPQPDGKRWVVVRPPGGGTALLLARAATPEQQAAVGRQAGGRVGLFLHTDDLARDHAAWRARGVVFRREPVAQPYGRVAVFEDLYGNPWDLIEPAGARSTTAPVQDRVLVHTAVLPLPAAAAFAGFATAEGLQSWLCERADVEPRTGGRYELFWDPEDPANDSTVGCRITACEAGQLLAFQWRSPRAFKPFANAADPLTHVVVAFHPHPAGCVVTLVHSGWRSGARWQDAADWQARAWDYAFQALQGWAARARQGPNQA